MAGVAALLLELNVSSSPLQMRRLLQEIAVNGTVGDTQGSPNVLLHTGALHTTNSTPPTSIAVTMSTSLPAAMGSTVVFVAWMIGLF